MISLVLDILNLTSSSFKSTKGKELKDHAFITTWRFISKISKKRNTTASLEIETTYQLYTSCSYNSARKRNCLVGTLIWKVWSRSLSDYLIVWKLLFDIFSEMKKKNTVISKIINESVIYGTEWYFDLYFLRSLHFLR